MFHNIYTRAHLHRSSELIQYNHIIHTISMAYLWENVYLYDKEFRLHMGRNPGRSWSVILHQAWAMRLKDKLQKPGSGSGGFVQGDGGGRSRNGETCRRYNRGRCNFGLNCKYEHRCSYCYKPGHMMLHCRRANAD